MGALAPVAELFRGVDRQCDGLVESPQRSVVSVVELDYLHVVVSHNVISIRHDFLHET